RILRSMAVAASYVYDAIKALAGAAAFAAGKIVLYLGPPIIGMLHDLAEAVAKVFPDRFGGKYFEGISKQLTELERKTEQTAADLRGAGFDMFTSFGKSAAKVGGFFDDLLQKFKVRERLGMKKPEEPVSGSMNNAAVERGSLEAFKIIVGDRDDKAYKVA